MTATVPSTVTSSTHDAMSLDSPLASQDGNNLTSVFHQPLDSMVHTIPEPSGQVSLSFSQVGAKSIRAPVLCTLWIVINPNAGWRYVPCFVWTMSLQMGSLCSSPCCTRALGSGAGEPSKSCRDASTEFDVTPKRLIASFRLVSIAPGPCW